MFQTRSSDRLKRLILGGTLAALLAVGIGGAAGAPSQGGHDAHQALNFTKIEYQTSAKVNPQDLHITMGANQALNFAKIEF